MELQTHDELALFRVVRVGVVEPFHQSVPGEGHGDEPLRQSLHPLMVIAVDLQLHLVLVQRLPEPGVQRRVLHHPRRVPVAVVVGVVHVDGGGAAPAVVLLGELPLDVLVQGAAAGDVEDLGAAADAEVGDVALQAELGEPELDGVLLAVDGGVAGVEVADLVQLLWRQPRDVGLVVGRVDVLPFAQQHAVDRLEAIEQHMDAGHAGDDHRHRPVPDYEIEVVFP